ncbi:MAG: MATE family efflux transporter, partial [Sphingomonas sp.]|nr:MATE family efflux transporter [Sphingomonas sp.]
LARPMLGVNALWWSFPVGSIATVVLAALFYRYGPWRKKRLTVPSVHATEGNAPVTAEQAGRLKPAG